MSNLCSVITNNCVGCGLCEKNCPNNAIHVKEKRAVVDGSCVGCNVCFKICPKNAIEKIPVPQNYVYCNSCPVHCNIPEGCLGSCQRFRNEAGRLVRIEALNIVNPDEIHLNNLTGLPNKPLLLGYGAGTNLYSNAVPSKFVVSGKVEGVDIITCVTEAVLSFNGAKVKVDTDENLGTNGSPIRREGVVVGYINTSEYGSRMLYFGGAELNTGSGGFMVARTVSDLLNKRPVTVKTDLVKELVLQHGKPPIVNGKIVEYMRLGCGSAVASGWCAQQWIAAGVDECIAIDYDITAKMSTHTTGGLRYNMKDSGITPVGAYSSPGRYFGTPGLGWGGSNIMEPEQVFANVDKNKAWPGMRVVVTEPTTERAAFFVADEEKNLIRQPIPQEVQAVLDNIRSNCEPCCTHVSVCSGFGGGVRNVISSVRPINVNRALHEGKIMYSICGVPAHVLDGGGITVEASVDKAPEGAFTWVPTPAGVTPLEVTMTRETYEEIGGYLDSIRSIEDIIENERTKICSLD